MLHLTRDIPGIGGSIKRRPEDFQVEELPLYEPSGEGEHLYLLIEKKRRTTTDMVLRLARAFHVSQSDIGYAGLKDKHAVTRQHFSIYLPHAGNDAEGLDRLDLTDARVLWTKRHANKLRRGHLRGNRFVIFIRDVEPDAFDRARSIVDRLVASGVPNYLGEQRFGYRQDNAAIGRLLILGKWQDMLDRLLGDPRDVDAPNTRAAREAYDRGDFGESLRCWPKHLRVERTVLEALRQGKSPHHAAARIDFNQRNFFISGLQSAVFNHVLERRIRDGLFDKFVEGDVAFLHGSRGQFTVDGATAQTENAPDGRGPTHAISPTGPLWGIDMMRAAGVVDQWERESLHAFDLTVDDLVGNDLANTAGARRALRMFVEDVDLAPGADEHGPYVRLSMTLDRGSFATVVLDEIMKTPGTPGTPAPGTSDNVNNES